MDGVLIKQVGSDTRYTRFAKGSVTSPELNMVGGLTTAYGSLFVFTLLCSTSLNNRAMPFRLHLSTDGENLAQDEPYVIRNGGKWELVIHTSDQIRELYRRDGKGQ